MLNFITRLALSVIFIAAGCALFWNRELMIRANFGLNSLIGPRYARMTRVFDHLMVPLMALLFCATGVLGIFYAISSLASGH
jgi:hypothetical protein